jgi:hypothetical protein
MTDYTVTVAIRTSPRTAPKMKEPEASRFSTASNRVSNLYASKSLITNSLKNHPNAVPVYHFFPVMAFSSFPSYLLTIIQSLTRK